MILVIYSSKDEEAREDFQSFCDPIFRREGWKLGCAEALAFQRPGVWTTLLDRVTGVLVLMSKHLLKHDKLQRELLPTLTVATANSQALPIAILTLDEHARTHQLIGLPAEHQVFDCVRESFGHAAMHQWKLKLVEAGKALLAAVLDAERPIIDERLDQTTLPKTNPQLVLLTAPVSRRVEVLVRGSNGIWYPQGCIRPGTITARIVIGGEGAGDAGLRFRIIAMTTNLPLAENNELTQLPSYRTCSREITVFRL